MDFLYNPGCLKTSFVDKAGLEYRDLPGFLLFPSVRIKVICHHHPASLCYSIDQLCSSSMFTIPYEIKNHNILKFSFTIPYAFILQDKQKRKKFVWTYSITFYLLFRKPLYSSVWINSSLIYQYLLSIHLFENFW